MPRRYFHRTDLNQPDIVTTLRKLGFKVHCWGEEADLLVQFGGITFIVEVRPADKPRTARKGRQEEFQKEFSCYWLQTSADCLALKATALQWHKAIREGIAPHGEMT